MKVSKKVQSYPDSRFNWTRSHHSSSPPLPQEPENAEVRCNLSYALLKECKYVKALEAANAAVAIDATMERAQFRKGLAHAALEE